MPEPFSPNDDIAARLAQQPVPPAHSNAVEQILQMAQATPRQRVQAFDPLRTLRAWIYVPQMRYAIMASVVGLFMLVGLIADPQPAPSGSAEPKIIAAKSEAKQPKTPAIDPLFDDANLMAQDPLSDFWEI